MNRAEERMLLELGKNDCRRLIDAARSKWLIIAAVGGFSANGGSLDDPRHRRFSRAALASMIAKGLIELRKDVVGSYPEKWYGLTAHGRKMYLAAVHAAPQNPHR